MRSALIGLLGLALGIMSALGFSHFLGEGKQLADAQTQLAAANASIAKATDQVAQAKKETDALTDQVKQLSASNDKLKHEWDLAKAAAPAAAAPAPAANPFANMGGAMKEYMARQSETRFQLLVAKLHLSPEQQAALKAAMEEQEKQSEAMTAKLFSGGKIDPQAMANIKAGKSVDQTLDQILNPEQKTQYQQIKTDEKNSQAEMVASVEMNQFASSMQLSDAQKDQVYTALTQVHLQAQDPEWIKNNVVAGNPASILDAQAKAKDDAMAKILTPEQMTTYRQQSQSLLDMQKAMLQKFTPAAPANAAPTASQ